MQQIQQTGNGKALLQTFQKFSPVHFGDIITHFLFPDCISKILPILKTPKLFVTTHLQQIKLTVLLRQLCLYVYSQRPYMNNFLDRVRFTRWVRCPVVLFMLMRWTPSPAFWKLCPLISYSTCVISRLLVGPP